jgi:hypothetical protein
MRDRTSLRGTQLRKTAGLTARGSLGTGKSLSFVRHLEMTNPIESQTEVLTAIVEIIYASTPSNFDEANCSFEYFVEDDYSWSVGSEFSYILNGEKVGAYLNDQVDRASILVAKLHQLMDTHTKGKWKSFSISLKNSGPATVKFQYD